MRGALAAALALAPAIATAGDCLATATTQLELNACAEADRAAADAELNRAWQEMRARLAGDAATLALLTASQRAWLGFRDAECRFATASVDGGSIAPMVASQCLEALTRARLADFHRYLACAEGDLACPLPPS